MRRSTIQLGDGDSLIERINTRIKAIETDKVPIRPEGRKQKIAVLEAAKKYLVDEITIAEFKNVIKQNPKYADSVGTSKTKELIDQALQTAPNPYLTKEGYIKKLK